MNHTKKYSQNIFSDIPSLRVILFVYNQAFLNPFVTEDQSMDWFLYDNGLRHEKVKNIDLLPMFQSLIGIKTELQSHLLFPFFKKR